MLKTLRKNLPIRSARLRVGPDFVRLNAKVLSLLYVSLIFTSCESFLTVEPPNSKITGSVVFGDDVSSTSAMLGVYIDLYDLSSFAGGSVASVMSLAGLSADELINKPKIDPAILDVQNNEIKTNNSYILSVWTSLYKAIYQANSVLEGLANSEGVSSATKNRLQGEALFVRAFCNFYLVNLFGDVPLATTTDYKVNASMQRVSSSTIYDQIKNDLLQAESLLPAEYVNSERFRPNKFAAIALEARVYLYLGDWARAEDKSTQVISQSSLYELVDIDRIFYANNREAIWQLKPVGNSMYSNEGALFSIINAPNNNVLNGQILLSFEGEDDRRNKWITDLGNGSSVIIPLKYKFDLTEPLPQEYSMVIRLGELYLIRGEARARQDKRSMAIQDVDRIRNRAGLPPIQTTNPDVNKEDLLNMILHERQIELMVEWGHRWLDLKRWGVAGNVLGSVKVGWSDDDLLYPIPSTEIQKNPLLNPQNPGY